MQNYAHKKVGLQKKWPQNTYRNVATNLPTLKLSVLETHLLCNSKPQKI